MRLNVLKENDISKFSFGSNPNNSLPTTLLDVNCFAYDYAQSVYGYLPILNNASTSIRAYHHEIGILGETSANPLKKANNFLIKLTRGHI